jgi:glycosyltransferase involved in cell wall biosynthesis
MEAENIKQLGFKNPIAIIPNGVDISVFRLKEQQEEKHTLLFLSRIHPKKGIEFLVEAWAQIDQGMRHNWKINIVGNGEELYIAKLKKLIQTKRLETEIQIIDPQFGNDKLKTFHKADLFVLPTFSENFGIVIAEAMACGIPVITTKGTPWEELNTYNAGWWIDIGIKPLVHTLQVAMQLSDEERMQMGKNGRKLVSEKYTVELVTRKMMNLYKWVLHGGEKPEFVINCHL